MKDKRIFRVRFDDKTLTIHTQYRGSHDGKAVMVREEEELTPIKYFKRKLIGK